MDKNAFFDSIRGQMIISCQAVKGEPLYEEERSVMYLMARAAKMAGTPAIRTSSIRDVEEIKAETGLPVIGLVKIQYPGYEGYITPTMKEVDDLLAAGPTWWPWTAPCANGEMGKPSTSLSRRFATATGTFC